MPVPGVGWLGYAKDPDGNLFGVMQRDPSAA
jgi:predicted enzyme related to lactoylglutathione lyase